MNFVSVEFFVLLATVLCVVRVANHRWQNVSLLIASYVFYGWWNWKYLPLIIGISLLDYYCAAGIAASRTDRMRKLVLALGVTANLSILAYFKYMDFFVVSVNTLAGTHWPLLNILLPIGVSFHTFQSMSYTIDVYRRKIKPIRNPLDYQLFVTFFPQLVAGPIERATHLLPQILKERVVRWNDVDAGLKLLVLGYFKKVVVADNLGTVVDSVYSAGPGSTLTGAAVLLATYAFALQIYCDFSGYTDIARGTARLLGFDLMENFRQPYFAVNPSDFWRRWHISLSTWLRDYLYIPLGGNRHGAVRTYLALAATMLIGGIWHGAAWTFVLWGAYHGALLIMYRASAGNRRSDGALPANRAEWAARILAMLIFFQITCLGWLIFRARTWENLTNLLGALASPTDWTSTASVNVRLVLACALIVFVIDLWNEAKPALTLPLWFKMASYTCVIAATLVWAPETISSFIYFQF